VTLVLIALAAGAHGATLNVANNGQDSGACGATASPCRSISQAIINAAAGDEIVVGPGRYGDLNADSIIGSGGDEKGAPGCSCLIAVNKSVIIRSTHGAAATSIDARSVLVFQTVLITADGVEFGRPGQGFTVTYPLDNTDPYPGGINVNANEVSVRGNLVVGFFNGRGAGISTFCTTGGGHIEDNQVMGWSIGIQPLCGTKNVSRNAVSFNGYGILAYTNAPVTDNILLGNSGTGIHIAGNRASGNFAAGNATGLASNLGGTLSGNAVLGNLIGIDADSDALSVSGNNIIGNQCGLRKEGFPTEDARNNFWGAASGPGPDPADGVCYGLSVTSPFATTPFNIANPLPAPSLYRIHAGGPSYTSSNGTHWIADSYFNTGTTVTTAAAIANTTDDPLYQTQRTDPAAAPELRYTIAVANGTYTVKLLFAEIVATAAGQRVFNVHIDGTAVLTNFDIFAAAGAANKAVAKAFNATVTNGTLTIDFVHVTGDPLIAAIEVLPQ
jgi:hypothetical protein